MNNNHSESKFEKAFNKLKDRIQFMVDHDKLSDKQITFYNEILRLFDEYHEEVEGEIFMKNVEIHKLSTKMKNIERKHENHVFQLEAICLMHGILDIHSWLTKPVDCCIQEVIRSRDDGSFIMPVVFRDQDFKNNWNSKHNIIPAYNG